jgi:hypothetical protein
MDPVSSRRGESETHVRLKRLAAVWAQTQGYSACALEVTLPRCRYRADVAAFKPNAVGGTSAIFECKQTLVDLRRDNGCTSATRRQLETVHRRRETLERNLRVHYPALRIPDSLFAEFDCYDLEKIDHRGYAQVLRRIRSLQNRLFDCTKFETLARYRCANLLFLVLPNELYRDSEIPIGWGALIESDGQLVLVCKPVWHDVTEKAQWNFLQRVAAAGTRAINQVLNISFEQIAIGRAQRI